MHLFPPIAGSLREARLLGFMPPPEGPGSTPAPSQDDVERDVAERTQRESQEQDPFANDNPAAAPEASRGARRRTEIQLSTADRQTVDRLKREASALSTMIEKLEQRLRETSQNQRDNVRGAMAISPRFGGGMGPLGAQRRLGAMSDWQMMQSLQTEINKLKGERETMYREIDRLQARGRAGLSRDAAPATETSAPASTQDRFSPNAPDGNRFDLETRMSALDPATADIVRDTPAAGQEALLRFMEGVTPENQAAARSLLEKVGTNRSTISALLDAFDQNGGTLDGAALEASTQEFVDSLTPEEKALLPDLLRIASDVKNNPPSAPSDTVRNVDQAQVDKYVTRWKEAKTEADRMIAEGMLLLNGVDTDASDLEKDQLVFLNEDTRIGGLIAGIFKLVQGMIEKFGGKSARIEAGNQPANEPALASLTPEQQDQKKTALEQTIEATEEKIETAEADLKKLETQRDAAEGTEREEIQGRIDRLKKDIKALTELLAQAQETLAELQRLINERNRGPKAEAGRPGEPTPQDTPPGDQASPEDDSTPSSDDEDDPPSGQFSIPPEARPENPGGGSTPSESAPPETPESGGESPEGVEVTEEQVEQLTIEADRLDQARATAESAVDGTPATMKAAIDAIAAELDFIDANPGLVALELISADEVTELRQRGQDLVDQYNVLVEKGGTSLEAGREEVVAKLRELSADAELRANMVVNRERSFAAGLEEDKKGSGWFGSLTRTLTLSDPWKIEIDQALQKASSMEFALDMNMKIINEELAKDPRDVDIAKVINAIESIQRTMANINKVDTDDEHWRVHDQALAVTRDVSIAVITLPAAFIGGPATASVGAAMKFGAISGGRVAFLQSATRNIDEVGAGNKTVGEAIVDTGTDTATGVVTGAALGGLVRGGANGLSRLRMRGSNVPPAQTPPASPPPAVRPSTSTAGTPPAPQASPSSGVTATPRPTTPNPTPTPSGTPPTSPPPLPNQTPGTPPPLPSQASGTPPPLPGQTPSTPPPLPSSSPGTPPPLPRTSPTSSPPPLPSQTPGTPPPLPGQLPGTPPPLSTGNVPRPTTNPVRGPRVRRVVDRRAPPQEQAPAAPVETAPSAPSTTPAGGRLDAARRQIERRLAEEGLEEGEKKFLEYSLRDINMQANQSLTPLQIAEGRLQLLQEYGSSLGDKIPSSFLRKVTELTEEIAALKTVPAPTPSTTPPPLPQATPPPLPQTTPPPLPRTDPNPTIVIRDPVRPPPLRRQPPPLPNIPRA